MKWLVFTYRKIICRNIRTLHLITFLAFGDVDLLSMMISKE